MFQYPLPKLVLKENQDYEIFFQNRYLGIISGKNFYGGIRGITSAEAHAISTAFIILPLQRMIDELENQTQER